MIIALPVNGNSMDADLSDTFGRAPYLLIYSTVSKDSEYLDHRAVAAQGGSGIRAAQVLSDHGVKAVITPQCGVNAEKVFRKAEVLVYKAISGSVQKNIDAFTDDRLNLLEEFRSR